MNAEQLEGETVFVEAPARLHFGVLDPRGSFGAGRWFGGIGTSAPEPTLLVSARRAETLAVEGEDAPRAANFARCFLEFHGIRSGARLRVHRAIPSHAGLGSGTQLALAVARAIAELHGVATDAPALARAVGRAQRSAVGTWTFAGGGLVVEGGRRRESAECSPLIARLPFPSAWRAVVAVPDAAPAISGAEEAAAFAEIPPPPEREVERVAALVLLALLPALADADLATFGAALSEIQVITGGWFASMQGGTFAPGPSAELVRRMAELGAAGVGQSSWGPAVYAVVESADHSARLAAELRSAIGARGTVYEGPFREEGARVWREGS
jgi:beta-RFAP synthase